MLNKKQIKIQFCEEPEKWIEIDVDVDDWEFRSIEYSDRDLNVTLQCMPLAALAELRDFLNYAVPNVQIEGLAATELGRSPESSNYHRP